MSLNSYSNYNNKSFQNENNKNNDYYQSDISQEIDNSNIQFETMLNNINEWQNNPIEATRLCFKYLYETNRSQQKKLEYLNKQKASKNELSTGLSTKGDLADIMQTFNEVAQNMDNRPTKDELLIILNEKVGKEELSKILLNHPSIDDLKKLLVKGDLNINLTKSFEELSKNFVSIKEFGEIINSKMSKENVLNLLNYKVSKSDIEIILNDFRNFKALDEKVKTIDNDLDRLIDHMKKQFNNIDNSINNLIKNKIEYKDFESINNKIIENNKNSINANNQLNHDIEQIKNEINIINTKYNNINGSMNEIKNKYNSFENYLNDNQDNVIKTLENKINSVVERINDNQINNEKDTQKNMNIIHQNLEQINQKIEDMENQKYITLSDFENISLQLKSDMKDFQSYIKDYLKNFDEELINNINTKMSKEEAKDILSQKADMNTIQKMISSKATTLEVDTIKLNLEKMNQELQNKINFDKFDSFLEKVYDDIQVIKNDLLLKSNIDEVMSYLKNKANIDDVNKALVDIHNDLDNKSSLEDFNHAMNNQNNINTYLAKENSIGKWIWQSGNVCKGYAVPWEVQVINTMPENIIWEKDDFIIMIKKKGIYLLSLGFFVREKPIIQVIINGESVLSQVNSNAFIVRQDNNNEYNKSNFGLNKDIENEEESEDTSVTGVSMNEFLCLKAMSKIVISYSGSKCVKGMMSIKQICPFE